MIKPRIKLYEGFFYVLGKPDIRIWLCYDGNCAATGTSPFRAYTNWKLRKEYRLS